jgi:hypothetical protein
VPRTALSELYFLPQKKQSEYIGWKNHQSITVCGGGGDWRERGKSACAFLCEPRNPGNLIKPDGARGRSDHERAVAGVAACESNPFDGTVGLAAACRGPAEAGATRIALQKAFCSRRGTYYCWPAPHRATTRLACPCPPQVPSLAQWHRRLGSSAPERAQIPVSLFRNTETAAAETIHKRSHSLALPPS